MAGDAGGPDGCRLYHYIDSYENGWGDYGMDREKGHIALTGNVSLFDVKY